MAKDLGTTVSALMKDTQLQKQIKPQQYVTDEIGLPTLNDILKELAKPGRDPREQFEVFSFTDGVNEIADLRVGMKLPGIVTNITNFGAFVDIGVHQDGLVHVSAIANRFIKDPAEVVRAGDIVKVKVVEVDVARKRIALTMRLADEVATKKTEGFERGPSGKPQGQAPKREEKPVLNSAFAAAMAKATKR